ncbi:MAG TPA: hydrophobic protein [Actinomycetota bacterium]|nr:hydrophobic protein [Actinomycetota bacterium]
MGPMLLVLLVALILFGLGFTMKILWWIALILIVVWLVGMIRPSSGRRFYRWGNR